MTLMSRTLSLLPLLLDVGGWGASIGSLHSRRTGIDMNRVWIWTPQQVLSGDDGHQAPGADIQSVCISGKISTVWAAKGINTSAHYNSNIKLSF